MKALNDRIRLSLIIIVARYKSAFREMEREELRKRLENK